MTGEGRRSRHSERSEESAAPALGRHSERSEESAAPGDGFFGLRLRMTDKALSRHSERSEESAQSQRRQGP